MRKRYSISDGKDDESLYSMLGKFAQRSVDEQAHVARLVSKVTTGHGLARDNRAINHRPPPSATSQDRINMLQQAIANHPRMRINDIEIKRPSPSYTIDTVKALRAIFPRRSLCYILATDAFAHFNQWHQSDQILDYCHLIIVKRPGFELPQDPWAIALLKSHRVHDAQRLIDKPAGSIYFQEITALDISASAIREQVKSAHPPVQALPKPVLDYIMQHHLYQ